MKNSDAPIEILPSVWQKRGSAPGPAITILGGVHGDETVGVHVVDQIVRYITASKIQKGVLSTGYGNPEAIQKNRRFIDKDLNRCFGKKSPEKNREEIRAQKLEKILAKTDILLDIHSTIKPSKPFICAPNLHHRYAVHLPLLGIKTIVTGKGLLPPDNTPIYADTFVCAQNGFGITIETGWQKDKTKISATQSGILRMMRALGVIDTKETAAKNISCEYWDAYWNVLAGEKFSFTKEWNNFDILEAGTHFATSDGKPLITSRKSIVLFPKPSGKIIYGQEACIIARTLSRKTPASADRRQK